MNGMKKTLFVLCIGIATVILPVSTHAAPHKVKTGDTFWKLAKQYQLSLPKVLAANPSLNPLRLQIGQWIELPMNSSSTESVAGNETAKATSVVTSQSSATPKVSQEKMVTMASGQAQAYSKVIEAKASAYSPAASENGKWGAVDYMGNALKLGTIAVDPNVIPMGTKVYVTGYQFDHLPAGGMIAHATDQGGAIKGNRVDIFIPQQASIVRQFGFQNVKVYILK